MQSPDAAGEDQAAALIAKLREQMAVEGDGHLWRVDIEADDRNAALMRLVAILDAIDEDNWGDVLVIGSA